MTNFVCALPGFHGIHGFIMGSRSAPRELAHGETSIGRGRLRENSEPRNGQTLAKHQLYLPKLSKLLDISSCRALTFLSAVAVLKIKRDPAGRWKSECQGAALLGHPKLNRNEVLPKRSHTLVT
ncbi:hypothetical protein CBL_04061 [Carabus blaptoides fortunei]